MRLEPERRDFCPYDSGQFIDGIPFSEESRKEIDKIELQSGI
jgi:hypothetical protein